MYVWRMAILCLLAAAPAAAQAAFEVVSIKPNTSSEVRGIGMKILPGGHVQAKGMPAFVLLAYAYNVPFNRSERLSGVPEWAMAERFDIEAKPPAGAFPRGLPANVARDRLRTMLRAMLAERFKLKMRRESKVLPAFALTVAPDGPKLQKSELAETDCPEDANNGVSCHTFMGGMGRGLHAKAIDMDDLVGYIENWTERPVLNQTGLAGLYAVETEGWAPMNRPPTPESTAPPNPVARPSGDGDMSDPARPTLFTVMRRLGLELKPVKGAVDVFTVEHMERPTAD